MFHSKFRSILFSFFLTSSLAGATTAFAQTDGNALGDKVTGIDERVSTLESSVNKMSQLKISGYVQPQWVWNDIDSLGNQIATRDYFQIRRGRVKFTHTTGNVSYVLYPDISETGVILKEAYATWNPWSIFQIAMGAMNRPFGYEIAYSSSAREVAERSQAENRLFNGERDLGLQFAVNPTFGTIQPLLEVGLFNGSDNFGAGPVSAIPGSNKLAFAANQVIGTSAAKALSGADSLLNITINSGLTQEQFLTASSPDANSAGFGLNAKELIGHIRLPFLLSDDFSFDIGGSWSVGGIAEPSNIIGKYSGTNGALVLDNSGTQVSGPFVAKNGVERKGLFYSNRHIFGGDAQVYLSVLPIGGTILKGEVYTGQQPFYGSSALFTHADSAALGTPTASTIYKNVMGFYGMLVQNISDNFQLAVRYDVFDPNTDVEGTNFNVINANQTDDTKQSHITSLRGINGASTVNGTVGTGFGGDLKLSTLTVSFNAFVSGALRLMFDLDIPKTEDYNRVVNFVDANKITHFTVQKVVDQRDDRFTFRMQYKF